jgi:hypothetical protein
MDKKKVKKISLILLILYWTILIPFCIYNAYAIFSKLNFIISGFLYWYIFFGFILTIKYLKVDSRFSFIVTLVLYSFGVFFTLIGTHAVGEILFRLCFITLIIAIVQTTIEYRKKNQ